MSLLFLNSLFSDPCPSFENAFGVDQLMLTFKFARVIESDPRSVVDACKRFLSFLSGEIGRDLSATEEVAFYKACLMFCQGGPGSAECLSVLEYILKLEFLQIPCVKP